MTQKQMIIAAVVIVAAYFLFFYKKDEQEEVVAPVDEPRIKPPTSIYDPRLAPSIVNDSKYARVAINVPKLSK